MKKLLITISNRNKSVAIYGDKYMKNPIESKMAVTKEKLVVDLIEASSRWMMERNSSAAQSLKQL